MNTEERIAKLPRWAQEHIAQIQGALDAAREDNRILRGDSDERGATVFADPYNNRTPIGGFEQSVEFNLPAEQQGIRFQKHVRISYNADHRNRGSHLVIAADNRVRITPQAANSFILEVD